MVKIILFILIIFINYCYCNNCNQNINSISPIHPSEEGLLVLVQLECQISQLDNSSSSIIFKIDDINSINCTNIEIVNSNNGGSLVQCKFGSLPSSLNLESFNFNQLYTVTFNLNQQQQQQQILYQSYLFNENKCICDHGSCIYGFCLCDERYSGSTCSLKTLKYNDDSNPSGVSYNTFKIFLKDDEFQVSTNGFIQSQLNSNDDDDGYNIINQLLISSMALESDYTTDTYLSFEANKPLSNFISKLLYNAKYYQSNQLTSFNIQSTNIFNSYGSLLPVSNNSVLVSASIQSQLELTNFENMNIEMIFTVSNKDQDLVSELSSDKLSITIYNEKTSSYITVSMSDRYLSMNTISPNHAYFRILNSDQFSTLFNISNSKSVYFSIVLPINSATPTNFVSEFVINGFNVEESLSTLKIIIISVSTFVFFCLCALLIFIFIKLKNKNFAKSLQMEPYFQPLISNKDVDSDDDDEFLLRH